jgi:hypothetical protein
LGDQAACRLFGGFFNSAAHTDFNTPMKFDLLWLATVLLAFLMLAEPAAADAGTFLILVFFQSLPKHELLVSVVAMCCSLIHLLFWLNRLCHRRHSRRYYLVCCCLRFLGLVVSPSEWLRMKLISCAFRYFQFFLLS